MKAMVLFISFSIFCAVAVWYFAPVVEQGKKRADYQAYQIENLMKGIDVKEEDRANHGQ